MKCKQIFSKREKNEIKFIWDLFIMLSKKKQFSEI